MIGKYICIINMHKIHKLIEEISNELLNYGKSAMQEGSIIATCKKATKRSSLLDSLMIST